MFPDVVPTLHLKIESKLYTLKLLTKEKKLLLIFGILLVKNLMLDLGVLETSKYSPDKPYSENK